MLSCSDRQHSATLLWEADPQSVLDAAPQLAHLFSNGQTRKVIEKNRSPQPEHLTAKTEYNVMAIAANIEIGARKTKAIPVKG